MALGTAIQAERCPNTGGRVPGYGGKGADSREDGFLRAGRGGICGFCSRTVLKRHIRSCKWVPEPGDKWEGAPFTGGVAARRERSKGTRAAVVGRDLLGHNGKRRAGAKADNAGHMRTGNTGDRCKIGQLGHSNVGEDGAGAMAQARRAAWARERGVCAGLRRMGRSAGICGAAD